MVRCAAEEVSRGLSSPAPRSTTTTTTPPTWATRCRNRLRPAEQVEAGGVLPNSYETERPSSRRWLRAVQRNAAKRSSAGAEAIGPRSSRRRTYIAHVSAPPGRAPLCRRVDAARHRARSGVYHGGLHRWSSAARGTALGLALAVPQRKSSPQARDEWPPRIRLLRLPHRGAPRGVQARSVAPPVPGAHRLLPARPPLPVAQATRSGGCSADCPQRKAWAELTRAEDFDAPCSRCARTAKGKEQLKKMVREGVPAEPRPQVHGTAWRARRRSARARWTTATTRGCSRASTSRSAASASCWRCALDGGRRRDSVGADQHARADREGRRAHLPGHRTFTLRPTARRSSAASSARTAPGATCTPATARA